MNLSKEQLQSLENLVQQYQLSFLVLFGSQAREQTHEGSDIDIGYRSVRGTSLSLEQGAKLEAELSGVLSGVIDLRSLHSENPYFLFSALRDAQFLAGSRTAFSRFQAYAFQL